jgi:biotin synthase
MRISVHDHVEERGRLEQQYKKWALDALEDRLLLRRDAVSILSDEQVDLLRLVSAAGDVRMATFGRKVKVHQIDNIKNGLCPEDCGYCSQSKISEAPIRPYRMKSEEEILAEAAEAKQRGVYRYCLVASGRGPNDRETEKLASIVRRITEEIGIRTCLSAGIVDNDKARKLKDAGLDRLNHNLNTSEAHTPKIVSTHTYQERVATIQAAREANLDVCSGMIAGMGEQDEDIVEVAYKLRELGAASIPINFLIPIPGNPIYDFDQLTPERCLRILCLFRFVNPKAEIRIAGGREGHLRDLQALGLYPANSLFVDGYLSTRGELQSRTFQMIEDAGFEIEGHEGKTPREFAIHGDAQILNPKTTHSPS